MHLACRIVRSSVLAVLLAAAAWAALRAGKVTALDRYVRQPDPNYRYELVSEIPGQGYTAYVLRMTSQQWRTETEVDRPVWKHWVTLVRPDRVSQTTGFLFITGGSLTTRPPAKVDPFDAEMALTTGSVVTELRDVPNEPLVFKDEGKPRTEDEIIAYTWVKYLKTGDETWPLRLPMTKAAVRAMDTITAFCANAPGGGLRVDRFFVSGASKRGWTTWTTAAVDRRVAAIAPIVIDVLNVIPSFEHHYRAYGFYAPSVKDYERMGIMEVSDTPRYRALMELVDPYSYRDRYTMPKYIINSTGDQFFLPDSSRFYFDDLPGEKYLRYVPNTDHSLKGSDARQSLLAFYEAFLHGRPRPRFKWKFAGNEIRVICADRPSEVRLWQAANPKARDFRLATIGPAWRSTALEEQGGGEYVARVARPSQGWVAFFVELTYPSGGKYPFKFTTGVRVLPDTLPYPKPRRSGRLPD